MSHILISTPFNIDLDFPVAPFHKRFFAWLLDMVIIVLYAYVVNVTILQKYAGDSYTAFFLFVLFPAYSYHFWSELVMNGQSLGKRVFRIKVVDKMGKGLSISQLLLRWIFRIIDISITMGMGALLSIALSPLNQRLGDILAGTVVINDRKETELHHTIYLDITQDDYKVMFPAVMKLTDRDINGIKMLLDIKNKSHYNEAYREEVAYRIKKLLDIDTQLDTAEFFEQLLKDYNYLTSK